MNVFKGFINFGRRSKARTFVVASALACSGVAHAASITWSGGGSDALWETPGNWLPNIAWGSNLVFQGSNQLENTNNIEGWRFAGITFQPDAGAFVLRGQAIMLNGPVVSNSSNTQTIAFDGVSFLTEQTFNVGAGGNVIVESPISGGFGLLKTGAGSLTLKGASAYTGMTTINEGRLILDLSSHSGGVLASNAAVTIANGGLVVRGAATGVSQQTLGNVSLYYRTTSRVTVDNNGGAGTTLTLQSLSDDTSGQLYVDLTTGGSLKITNAPSTINGVYSQMVVTDSVGTGFGTLGAENSIVRYTGAEPLSTSGSAATGNYSVTGNVTMDSTRHDLYTLSIDSTGDGSLDVGAEGSLVFSSRGAILVTGSGDYVLNGGGTFGSVNNGQEFVLHHAGSGLFTSNLGLQLQYSNIFTKDGEGTVVLAAQGLSQHGTLISINEGTIRMGHETALGTGGLVFNYAENGISFGTSSDRYHIGALGGDKDLTLEDANGDAITLVIGGAAGTGTYYGAFRGTGALESAAFSDRTNTIAGVNTHTGGTIVTSGTLRVVGEGTLGASEGSLSVNGGVLDLSGTTQTVGSFSGAGGVVTSSQAGGGLTFGSSADDEFSGAISGQVFMTKRGSGAMKYTAAATTDYTGDTNVSEGRLIVDGTLTSSVIHVGAGAGLAGSGTVGSVVIEAGAAVAAGFDESVAVGQLTASSLTQLEGSGQTIFEIAINSSGDGVAGVNWSSLAVSGAVDLSDASTIKINLYTLNGSAAPGLLGDWDPFADHVWEGLIVANGGISLVNLDVFEIDTTFFQNQIAGEFQVRLSQGGNSLDLVYSAVPEPGTWGMLIVGAFVILWSLRRRVEGPSKGNSKAA